MSDRSARLNTQDNTRNPEQSLIFNNSSQITNLASVPKKSENNGSSTPQQAGQLNANQDDIDVVHTLADESLFAKKTRMKLHDSNNLVVDRTDQTSPLFSAKSFNDLNLKPEILKGNREILELIVAT
jgi:NAD dependent epimerase/dehydratase family enzyme